MSEIRTYVKTKQIIEEEDSLEEKILNGDKKDPNSVILSKTEPKKNYFSQRKIWKKGKIFSFFLMNLVCWALLISFMREMCENDRLISPVCELCIRSTVFETNCKNRVSPLKMKRFLAHTGLRF